MTVADIMTSPPICVRRRTRASTAIARMRRADVRHLAVVDGGQRLLGILSDRDLLRVPDAARLTVGKLMTIEVLTVRPETHAHEASGMLLDRKIGALPVVDDDGRVLGMVTETDYLRVAHGALRGGLLLGTRD